MHSNYSERDFRALFIYQPVVSILCCRIWGTRLKRMIGLVGGAILSVSVAAQESALLSCDELAQKNSEHLHSLKVGMSKAQVLATMGEGECKDVESKIKNPAKVSSFYAGSDFVEVLLYRIQKIGPNSPDAKPVWLLNGIYKGDKIGFVTSPPHGS